MMDICDWMLQDLHTHGPARSWDAYADLRFAQAAGMPHECIAAVVDNLDACALGVQAAKDSAEGESIRRARLRVLRRLARAGAVACRWEGTGPQGYSVWGVRRMRVYELTDKGARRPMMDARARYEAALEAGPPEGEPEPCPVCGEPLTEVVGGGAECEVNGCSPCPVCYEDEATCGGMPCGGVLAVKRRRLMCGVCGRDIAIKRDGRFFDHKWAVPWGGGPGGDCEASGLTPEQVDEMSAIHDDGWSWGDALARLLGD